MPSMYRMIKHTWEVAVVLIVTLIMITAIAQVIGNERGGAAAIAAKQFENIAAKGMILFFTVAALISMVVVVLWILGVYR